MAEELAVTTTPIATPPLSPAPASGAGEVKVNDSSAAGAGKDKKRGKPYVDLSECDPSSFFQPVTEFIVERQYNADGDEDERVRAAVDAIRAARAAREHDESKLADAFRSLTTESQTAVPAGDGKAGFKEKLDAFLAAFPFGERSELRTGAIHRTNRKELHQMCSELGYETVSLGWGASRYLTVRDPRVLVEGDKVCERFVDRGYVSLEGPLVDYFGATETSELTAGNRKRRENRDGPKYHITLANRFDLERVAQQPEYSELGADEVAAKVTALFAEQVPDSWQPVGVGKVETETTKAVFYVIDWPEANAVREKLGLQPQDFHITMGFTKADVHDVPKGRDTLV